MDTSAIILKRPEELVLDQVALQEPGPSDVVVDIAYSAVSTGTEKLFWTGQMPPFPGMGYPLVPGYESLGTVVAAGPQSGRQEGETVFVPGANCFRDVRGLFGGAAAKLVVSGERVVPLADETGPEGALYALAATARHALAAAGRPVDLIVGHGVLGRLLARIARAEGAAPTVWERDPARRSGGDGYEVIDPEDDPRRDYACILDASGNAELLDPLIGRLAKGGELVLAGFYPERIGFAFVPAFLKELRLRVAAEWQPEDLEAVRSMVARGALSLSGLITHCRPASDAAAAYPQAFDDPACLKLVLDWRH